MLEYFTAIAVSVTAFLLITLAPQYAYAQNASPTLRDSLSKELRDEGADFSPSLLKTIASVVAPTITIQATCE
tara:strand:+ start:82 stop:300 length:219 start_codon:yes stop_codon:yes gene_type:complete